MDNGLINEQAVTDPQHVNRGDLVKALGKEVESSFFRLHKQGINRLVEIFKSLAPDAFADELSDYNRKWATAHLPAETMSS